MIKSIAPATGWKSVYADKDGPFLQDLAVFVTLADENGFHWIEGYDGWELIDSCQDSSNFLGYKSPNSDIDFHKINAEFMENHPEYLERITTKRPPNNSKSSAMTL